MTLMFGNLTQSFVDFAYLLGQAQAGDPRSAEKIPAAAAHFRHVAAKDAGYLAFIGESV
jgi:ATP-binding cassette subfamily B (MDR/TAP) protein 1